MATLQNAQIYSGDGRTLAPALAALNDILRQRMGRDLGKLVRRVERTLNQQVEEVGAEHKRIIELYSPKGDDGQALPLTTVDELTDKVAFDKDYSELMRDTFEVEGIPVALLDGMQLAGATWISPLLVEDGAQPEKKEGAGDA